MASVKLARAYDWEFPYPIEEHDARVMCGDPIAVIYHKLEQWVTAQNFNPPVTMQEVIQCLWSNHYGTSMTKYDIVRSGVLIPNDLPDEIFHECWRLYAPSSEPAKPAPKRKMFP